MCIQAIPCTYVVRTRMRMWHASKYADHVYIHTYTMCARTHTCMHTYMHPYIHAYVHTCTHACTHKQPQFIDVVTVVIAICHSYNNHTRSIVYNMNTANIRTKILEFRGFDSSRIVMLRGGIPRPLGNFPESLSQQILAWRFLVGRLAVVRIRVRERERSYNTI